jgi:hypothetical protein
VDAAWGGAVPAHLADCAHCRDEVEAVRGSVADLGRETARPSVWRRPELAWAAALLLALPAGLYVAEALRGGPPDGPVVRGPSPTSRVTAPQPLALAAGAAAVLPRAEVLLDFARAGEGPGHRQEARLVDGRGVTLWEGILPEVPADARTCCSTRATSPRNASRSTSGASTRPASSRPASSTSSKHRAERPLPPLPGERFLE